jgi:hypothetical protein
MNQFITDKDNESLFMRTQGEAFKKKKKIFFLMIKALKKGRNHDKSEQ